MFQQDSLQQSWHPFDLSFMFPGVLDESTSRSPSCSLHARGRHPATPIEYLTCKRRYSLDTTMTQKKRKSPASPRARRQSCQGRSYDIWQKKCYKLFRKSHMSWRFVYTHRSQLQRVAWGLIERSVGFLAFHAERHFLSVAPFGQLDGNPARKILTKSQKDSPKRNASCQEVFTSNQLCPRC